VTESMHEVALLRCRRCSSHSVHHGAVDVGYRRREDVAETHRVVVEPDGVVREYPGAYEGRRQDVAVDMWCESCGYVGTLVLAQSKGRTLIGWQARTLAVGKPPCEMSGALRDEDDE
jgi:hypothetical protein